MHTQRQIRPFHQRRADVFRVGIANANLGYDLHEPRWGVPPLRGIVLSELPKQFDKLREVHIHAKALGDRLAVEVEAVSRELNAIGKPLRQVPAEHLRGVHGSLSDCECGNQFAIRVKAINTH